MAHPLIYRGKYFFYPIGNTSAVCLTRDVAPEVPANILLLGCGDSRHLLYTIFSENRSIARKLDFTCCDVDPAVLARNVLLLTMVADGQPDTTTIWNIYFHFYIDTNSHSVLVEQCKKLVGLSDSLKSWRASPYGRFIKMCTEHTLAELRRHWSLYIGMQDLPRKRRKAIEDAFTQMSKSSMKLAFVSSARSCGPLIMRALEIRSNQPKTFWKTGTTFPDPKQISNAKMLNPTFAYCLAGEGCFVHYGTDPLIPFHLAALFGNATGSVSASDVVNAAKAEFAEWCSAFHDSISTDTPNGTIIRFFACEAIALCRALDAFATSGTLECRVPAAQWKAQLIQLSKEEYLTGDAPVTFNIIDTSNLDDHVGLLNVLTVTIPILSKSGVLYTEFLVSRGVDATKEFTERLFADIASFSLLVGLCPIDYLSGFSSRSNTHELMIHHPSTSKATISQFHQVTTWKSPASCDSVATWDEAECEPPIFDPCQLATLLCDMYRLMFEQEDALNFQRINEEKGHILKAIATSNLVFYVRESFVLFLKLVRDRLCISPERWTAVMTQFFAFRQADLSMPMDTVNFNDFACQLYHHRVYTAPFYHMPTRRIGIFSKWDAVPPLVRIILTIPREPFNALKTTAETVGTPVLHCDVKGIRTHNIFSTVHIAFGRVALMGSGSHSSVLFTEDPEGWDGTSSIVASFVMSSGLLTDFEPMEQISVNISVRGSTASVMHLVKQFGIYHHVFSAKLLDENHVHILPEQPLPLRKPRTSPPSPQTPHAFTEIGSSSAAVVELDQECELVSSLVSKISVEDKEVIALFSSGATPLIKQVSPCLMRITIGSHAQDVRYPFPVVGSRCRLRLARKSLYIDVVVPISSPFNPDGMKLNPFAVVRMGEMLSPWTIHRLNLSCLPTLDFTATKIEEWLEPHVGSMMSTRERSLRKHHGTDTLMFIKDTLNTIFVGSSGTQLGPRRRVFSLQDQATNNCDTLFFITDLRFDLHCHTMICDGYILPLTRDLLRKIEKPFTKLLQSENLGTISTLEGGMQAWKKLIPAFVERCRSWTHGANCEYLAQRNIPLTEEMESVPLCSCGRGKDTEGMSKVALWRNFAPYVTRIALSPLFAVSYLETVGRDPRCSVCRRKGKPKLLTCTVCRAVKYCSKDCQKKDWKVHKQRCNPL